MHMQVWIIDRQRAGWRQGDCSVYCLHTLLEQLLVKIKAAPTLAVKRIRDIELCAGVSLRRICLLPFVACRTKLLTPEEAKSGIEFFLVDFVSAGGDLSTGRHVFEAARFRGIEPDDERSVCDRESEAGDLNNFGLQIRASVSERLMHLERATMRLRCQIRTTGILDHLVHFQYIRLNKSFFRQRSRLCVSFQERV